MNIRGKAWCPNCKQEQPASLVGLSINGEEKTVTGFCSVCEHAVERTFTLKLQKRVVYSPQEEDNCVPLHPPKDIEAPVRETSPSIQSTAEVERPSILTFVALFSVCLVITYLL